MTNLSIKRIDRGDGKELILFSQNPINYKVFEGLPPISDNKTHLRYHPTRFEWVGYSTSRPVSYTHLTLPTMLPV